MKHKLLTLFILLVFATLTKAAVIQGSFKDLIWSLNTNDSTLTFIEGKGNLYGKGNQKVEIFKEHYGGKLFYKEYYPWLRYNSCIKRIILPECVDSIGNYAFFNCNNLESINFHENIKYVGKSVFGSCVNIMKPIYNKFVFAYMPDHFANEYTIPDGIVYMATGAFEDVKSPIAIKIPKTMAKLNSEAFNGCFGLTSITIPKEVIIQGLGFVSCKSLFMGELSVEQTECDYYGPKLFFTNFCYGALYAYGMAGGEGEVKCFGCLEFSYDPYTGKPYEDISTDAIRSGVLVLTDKGKTIAGVAYIAQDNDMKLSDDITARNYNAFDYSENLTKPVYNTHTFFYLPPDYEGEYVIPNGIKTIANGAFKNCTKLTSLTIPNSVTSIHQNAFDGCLPWLVKSTKGYKNGPFVYTDASKQHLIGCTPDIEGDVIIPESVISIGDSAFFGCDNITNLYVPTSVITIGKQAFYKVLNIIYNGSATNSGSWGHYAKNKYGEGYLVYADETKNKLFFCSPKAKGEIVIPATVKNINSYEYFNSPFCECKDITSIVINAEEIEDNVFVGMHELETVVIGENVKKIHASNFIGCYKLKNIVWNAVDCEYVAVWSYYNKGFLMQTQTITFGNKVKSIPDYLCYGMNLLESVIIPKSVNKIGFAVFYDCSNLSTIHFESAIPPTESLYYSVSNKNIHIEIPCGSFDAYSKEMKELSENLVEYSIFSIIVQSSDEKHGTAIITENQGCHKAVIQATVTNPLYHFGKWSDGNTDNPRTITITSDTIITAIFDANKCGDNLWWQLDGNTLTISGIGDMWDYSSDIVPWDYKCATINIVSLCEGVGSIGEMAFNNCSRLTSVTIPNSVTSIGRKAFSNCSNLKDVIMESSTPPSIGYNAFPSTIIVYVPLGSLSAYKVTGWKTYNLRVFNASYKTSVSPTSAAITFSASLNGEDKNKYIAACGMEEGEEFSGNTAEYIGLEPGSQYKDVPFYIRSTKGDIQTVTATFKTTSLILTTLASKAVSNTTSILLAETNMSDSETSCGFEWRRNDQPADMPSNQVLCPVANGLMAGRLKGLKDDVYYKYRAFYKSAAGNIYYGDWQYIFTGDVAVEFDPVLYTYAAQFVSDRKATLKGYALPGADDFTEQGFEYWAESRRTNAPARRAPQYAIGEKHMVTGTGISMRVTLEDLDEGTVYKYRTYAKVGGKTLYGSEMTFTTQGTYEDPIETDLDLIPDADADSLTPTPRTSQARKYIRNGILYIEHNGITYTAQGHRLD